MGSEEQLTECFDYIFLNLDLNSLFREVALSAHNALDKWTHSNIVTLAAMELLSSLARLQFDALSKSKIPIVLSVYQSFTD